MELSPRSVRNRQSYGRLNAYTVLASLAAALCVVALIFTAWFTAIKVSDSGMAPSLEPGEVVLCDKLSLTFRTPRRGDMAAYEDTLGSEVYIGRIVGLPGETVSIFQGKIYINGSLLLEDYAQGLCPWDAQDIRVAEGCFVLLPDKRDKLTSAVAEELIISAQRILGRIAVRVSPMDKIAWYK